MSSALMMVGDDCGDAGAFEVDRVDAAVAALTDAVAVLQELAAAGALTQVPWGRLLAVTAALHSAADATRAVAVAATVVVDDRDAARATGATSTSVWLQRAVGMSTGGAGATLGTGRTLTDYAATRDAWLAGRISEAAVREITTGVSRAVRGLPPERQATERARCEQVLLHLATTRTPAEVRRAAGRLRIEVAPDGAAAAAAAARNAQYLRFTPAPDGVDVRGFLTTEAAAGVLTALDKLIDDYHRSGLLRSEQRAAEDLGRPWVRPTREQLNARAMGDIAGASLDRGALGTSNGQRPHVTYTIHHDELTGDLGGTVLLPGFGPVAVPTATLDRVLCDAEIHPVLTRPDAPAPRSAAWGGQSPPHPLPTALAAAFTGGRTGDDDDLAHQYLVDDTLESWGRRLTGERGRHVVDLGRSFRTAPPALRRALEVRDGGCVAPGCPVDPSRCEAHHVTYWRHGGTTSLHDMALVCLTHHHDIHEGGWILAPRPGSDPGDPDRWTLTPPPPRSHPDD